MRRAVALCCALLPHGVEARVANEVDDKHSLEDAFGLMSGNSTFVQPKVLAAADDGGGDEVPDDWDPKPLTHDDWGLNDGSSSFDMRKHIFQGRGIFKGLSFDLTRQEHGGATGLNVAKNAIDDAKVHIQGEYSWGGRMVLVGSKPGKKPEALAAVQKVGMLSPMPNFVIFAQSDQVNYDDATDEFFAGGEDAPPKAHQPLHCATYHCGDKPAQVTCRSQDVEKAKKACEDGNQKFHNKPATLYPYAMMYEKKVSLVMRWHVQMITGWDDAGQPMHATDFYMPDYVVKPWSKKWTLGVATLSMGVYRGGAKKAYEDEVCNSYAKWFSGPSYQFTLSPGKKAVRKNTKQRMLDMPLMMMIQAVKTRVQNNRRQLKMLLAAIYLAPNVGALAANPAMLKTAAGAAKTELGKLGSMVKTHDFSGLMKEIGEKSAAGGEWILGDFQSKFQLSTWKNLFDQTKNGATAAVGSFKNLADKAAGKAKSAATSLFDKAKSLFGGGSAPTRSLTAPTPASTPSPTLSLTTAPPTLSAGMPGAEAGSVSEGLEKLTALFSGSGLEAASTVASLAPAVMGGGGAGAEAADAGGDEDLPEGSSSFLGRAGEEAEEATPDEWEAPGEEGGYDGHGGGEYNEDEEDDWENVTEAGDDDQEAEEAGTGVLVADPSPEVHEERKIINEEFAKWTRKVGSYQKELEHARGTAPDHHETAEKITALQPLVIEHKDLLGTFQEKCEEVGSLTTKILALVNSIHGQRVALVLQKYHQQQLQLATQQVVNANKKLRSTVQKHVPGAALGAAEDDEEDDEEEYPGGEAAEPEAQDLEGENLGEVADLEAGQARAAAAGGEPMDGEAADRDDAALPAATPPAALPRSMSAPVRGPGIRNGANTLPGDCTPAQQQQYDNLRRADPDVRAATGLFSAMEGGDGEDSVSCASARQSNAQLQGGQADMEQNGLNTD